MKPASMFTFYITTIVVYFNLLVSGMVVFQSADMPPIKLIDFKYRHRFSYVDSDQIILPNIVGGKEVSPKFYHSPWLAAIRKNDYQFCAGTLISKNILVTAARKYNQISNLIFKINLYRLFSSKYSFGTTGSSCSSSRSFKI